MPKPCGESELQDHRELVRAIREGRFAERAGLQQEIEAAREAALPGRVRVDFLSGTEVPDDERSKLDELARRLTERDGVRVDVLGCSDPSGSEALNLRISQARAESVAGTLEQLGLPGDRIGRVEGRGESRGCRSAPSSSRRAGRKRRAPRADA
jgi:outer membrane protein OmpA-like peptidoglycan-associated protein